jgi:signal recognition particle subunit SEC65
MEQADQIQKKWVKIYPSYLDKDIKCSEGRKIPLEIAVSNPNTKEIFVVCSELLKLGCKEEKVIL